MHAGDCKFEPDGDEQVCSQCGFRLPASGTGSASDSPPRRNCPRAPSLGAAAQRLGISWEDVEHYAAALARWTTAGFPTRAGRGPTHCRPALQRGLRQVARRTLRGMRLQREHEPLRRLEQNPHGYGKLPAGEVVNG